MSLTYNQILTAMKSEYFSRTNTQPDSASDLSLRLEILATQLYSLVKKGDYILEQAFLQTATGKCLEDHCAVRGIVRKGFSKSYGKIRFCVNEPAETNIQIPKGTICASSKNNLLRFATTVSVVLQSKQLYVDVDAQALVMGSEYDAKAGEITVMVVPPSGIDSVTNQNDFEGGYSGENDDMLRDRAINSLKNIPNGMNKQDILDKVLENAFVIDANVYRERLDQNDQGNLSISVRTNNDQLTDVQKNTIVERLSSYMIYPYGITVVLATKVPVSYSLSLFVETGADKAKAIQAAKEICKSYNDTSKIGKTFSLIELGNEIEKIPQIHHFQFETSSGNKVFSPADKELIYSTSQEVVAYDW